MIADRSGVDMCSESESTCFTSVASDSGGLSASYRAVSSTSDGSYAGDPDDCIAGDPAGDPVGVPADDSAGDAGCRVNGSLTGDFADDGFGNAARLDG